MTYVEALQRIADGGFVARPDWCALLLVREWPNAPTAREASKLCLEHDDGKREDWIADPDDVVADDWEDHFGFEGLSS